MPYDWKTAVLNKFFSLKRDKRYMSPTFTVNAIPRVAVIACTGKPADCIRAISVRIAVICASVTFIDICVRKEMSAYDDTLLSIIVVHV